MRIEKFKVKLPDGRVVTHPAFIKDGKEIDGIDVSDPIEFDDNRDMAGSFAEGGGHLITFIEFDALQRYVSGNYEKEE